MTAEISIPLAQLLPDLKQHLANMEEYAATCNAAGVQPEIELEGPQHESMAQVIRRLGSGQTCSMSLRYLRAIVGALEATALTAPPAEENLPTSVPQCPCCDRPLECTDDKEIWLCKTCNGDWYFKASPPPAPAEPAGREEPRCGDCNSTLHHTASKGVFICPHCGQDWILPPPATTSQPEVNPPSSGLS